MAVQINNTGNYFANYHATVWISVKWKISTLNGFYINYNVNSSDNGQPCSGWVKIYNLSPSHLANLKINSYISVWTGPPSLFGKIGCGHINKIQQDLDGKDKSVTLTFTEDGKANSVSNIKDTQTNKKGKKSLINHTFPKNTKTKTIISYILNKSKIKVGLLKLANNKSYKRGYTLSQKPFPALQGLADDCGSKLYYRNNQLIFDDLKQVNPFHEHIYLSMGSGLTAQPSKISQITSGKGSAKKTVAIWDVQGWDDPRLNAGSYCQIGSRTLNGFCRAQSVNHSLDDGGYNMEVKVYES